MGVETETLRSFNKAFGPVMKKPICLEALIMVKSPIPGRTTSASVIQTMNFTIQYF